jgi:hypothetical protein
MTSMDPTYDLYIDCPLKGREAIVEGEKDPVRIRRIATSRSFTKRIKARMGRKAVITKDNRVMAGGARALDRLCYEKWLEEHQPA